MLWASLEKFLLLSSLLYFSQLLLSHKHAWKLVAAVSVAHLQQKTHAGNPWEDTRTEAVAGARRKPFQTTPRGKATTLLQSLMRYRSFSTSSYRVRRGEIISKGSVLRQGAS